MNKFYQQPIFLQWVVAILLFAIGLWPLLTIGIRAVENPLIYLLFFAYIPLGQFCFTPMFTLTGVYKYYSPMLLGYLPNDKHIDLHSGGNFDYLFVFALEKGNRDLPIKRRIMQYHLAGLLNLIQRIEEGELPETVVISGTSYFFNERTAAKFGFSTEEPSLFYKSNLFVNFIDLFWMYSLSQGRPAIPRLWEAKKMVTTGRSLVDHKRSIQRYAAMLSYSEK